MRVALIGSTGLIGSQLVPLLLGGGHEVHLLQRRPWGGPAHPLLTVHAAPAERWPALAGSIAPEAAISCLGTTMKLAGSQAAFRQVDHDMVVAFAAAARAARALRMATVSSVGADAGSRNFYLRIKGEMEEALAAMGFDRLDVFRPGLLRGERGPERRLGERIGILVSPLVNLVLRGPLRKYAAIDAAAVAAAIGASLDSPETGRFVHHNRDILHSG